MTDPLKYKRNADLRAEIAYTAGGDHTRYTDRGAGLRKSDIVRVAEALRPDSDDRRLADMTLAELYQLVCSLAGGVYGGNAGNQWGITRQNLKKIHRALDATPPREVPA